MYKCLITEQQQNRKKNIRNKLLTVLVISVVAFSAGLWQAYSDLTQPVGSVSTDYCSEKPCAVFTFTPNRS